ncbi:MAG: histidine kinase [Chitinophagaceae bacterium]|nr:histidine kinase [Chitinophagaceae bacterium]
MAGRFKKDRVILYVTITLGFLVHWIYDDLDSNAGDFGVSLLNNFWQVIYVVEMNFLYFEYALPFVTSRKTNRVIVIVSSILVHLVVLAIGLYGWRSFGNILGIYHNFRNFPDAGAAFYNAVRFTPGSFLVFAVCKLFFDYAQLKFEGQQVQLEKKQAELVFLKAQINPHFLFNTLNNIYSQSQYEPQLVSGSILQLSKLLRYMLYETSSEFITVDKEVKIINDYIDLEKLRYNENVTIDVKYDIEKPSEMIPPLLLIPLVENAFKHGISESRGKRFVEVILRLQNQQLYFSVKNSSDTSPGRQEIKENIGLPNLRRRLNLLYKEFDLFTEQKDPIFTAVLKIDLSSHV